MTRVRKIGVNGQIRAGLSGYVAELSSAILTAVTKAEEAATLLLRLGGRAPAEDTDLDHSASATAPAA